MALVSKRGFTLVKPRPSRQRQSQEPVSSINLFNRRRMLSVNTPSREAMYVPSTEFTFYMPIQAVAEGQLSIRRTFFENDDTITERPAVSSHSDATSEYFDAQSSTKDEDDRVSYKELSVATTRMGPGSDWTSVTKGFSYVAMSAHFFLCSLIFFTFAVMTFLHVGVVFIKFLCTHKPVVV
ncbi:hypothetical protein OF83DRAFT_1180652 [Amylostereum chailletii]|nr:hypothetical protein OF83DRAFT_1180652 [Amylostereum chailletii]